MAAASGYSGPHPSKELCCDPSLHSQEERGAWTAACVKPLEKGYQSLHLQSLTSSCGFQCSFYLKLPICSLLAFFLLSSKADLRVDALWRPELFSLTSVKPSLLEGNRTETPGHAHWGACQAAAAFCRSCSSGWRTISTLCRSCRSQPLFP